MLVHDFQVIPSSSLPCGHDKNSFCIFFFKNHSCSLSNVFETLNVNVLYYTNLKQIMTKACLSYSGFSRSEKKIKIQKTMKAHISVMDGWIALKYETGSAPPLGSFHSKNG